MNDYVPTTLVRACCKAGELDNEKSMLHTSKTIHPFLILIHYYCQEQFTKEAEVVNLFIEQSKKFVR